MKLVVFLCLFAGAAYGLPNSVFSAIARGNSPLDGQDLTEEFFANEAWHDDEQLPGKWVPGVQVGEFRDSYLIARPKVFGVEAVMVKARHRENRLEELQVTFADAGSFFGYYQAKLPENLSRKEAAAESRRRILERQTEFQSLYQKQAEDLQEQLAKRSAKSRKIQRGKTRALRAQMTEFSFDEMTVRLLAAPDRLLRLTIRKKGELPDSWMDHEQAELSKGERLRALAERSEKRSNGDFLLTGVPIVPQGYRPYCGLNTLTMAARFFGLHLDEDWLAVAGKFQNTGSAAGSDMMGLYKAVAKEAGVSLARSRDYQHATVRRSLQAGLPVIVWRRWSPERDRLHTKISREVSSGSESMFPDANPKSFPNDSAPLHASVIVGFNEKRKEVLFLESWAGLTEARRMPVNELDATAYYTFSFQP